MKNLRISTKIAILTIGLMCAGIGVSAFLLTRLNATTAEFDQLTAEIAEPRALAGQLEIVFLEQIQEWKNILLRGRAPEELATHKQKWGEAEPEIRDLAAKIKLQSPDREVDNVMDDFLAAYAQLITEERAALEVYASQGPAAVDALVRGKDRPVVAKLAEANTFLASRAANGEAAADADAAAARRLSILVMLLVNLGLAIIAWLIARSIVRPLDQLAKAVAKISDANASDIQLTVGTDEVGQLSGAYKELLVYIGEVGAAIEKLAAGDFTAAVKPRSEHDLLSTRFTAVTTTLRKALGEVGGLVNAAREGRLDQRADATAFHGTYREVITSINGLMDAVRGPIDEAVQVMERMAARDLRDQMKGSYSGEFDRLKRAINTALTDVSSSIGRVSSASEHLSLGSSEIQRGSASLAQNTTEMASAVQAISERTTVLSTAAADAATRARDSEKAASTVADLATAGVRRMDQMSAAMTKIKESAAATSRIMQAINEIAFQTNLLALNAAVEAARAGDAGKGFAVVAEEVRSLALRSAESASNTGKLIEDSMRAADEGVQMNAEATQSLHRLATEIHRVAGEISSVAVVVDNQKIGLNEIKQSVGEISVATQNTAALAEESASTADVLNTHGHKLRQLVDAFQIDRRDAATTAETPAPPTYKPTNGHTNGHANGKSSRSVADLLSAF